MHFPTKQATAGPGLGATAPREDSKTVVLQGLLRSPHACGLESSPSVTQAGPGLPHHTPGRGSVAACDTLQDLLKCRRRYQTSQKIIKLTIFFLLKNIL